MNEKIDVNSIAAVRRAHHRKADDEQMIVPVVQMDNGSRVVPNNGRASPARAPAADASPRVPAAVRRTIQHNIPGLVLLRHRLRSGHVMGPRPPPVHPGRSFSAERLLRCHVARRFSGT